MKNLLITMLVAVIMIISFTMVSVYAHNDDNTIYILPDDITWAIVFLSE
ncbi:MAG: hypothetical protein ACE5RC_05025 [Nitrosopumilus sp.]